MFRKIALILFILLIGNLTVAEISAEQDISGQVSINGKYFEINGSKFYAQGGFNDAFETMSDATIDSELSLMKNNGFNVYFASFDGYLLNDADQSNDSVCSKNVYALDKAQELGMKILYWNQSAHRYGENLEAIEYFNKCPQMKNHPAIFAMTMEAGEIRFGKYEQANQFVLQRKNMDPDFWSWLMKEYGSVEAASSKLGYSFQVYQPENDSQCVSHNMPSELAPGQTVTVDFSMKNTGTQTWVKEITGTSGPYTFTIPLHFAIAIGDSEKFLEITPSMAAFGETLGNDIAPGETADFTATITAPSTPGEYEVGWRMIEWNQPMFGTTCKETIKVVSGATANQEEKTFDYSWREQKAVRGMPNDFCIEANKSNKAYVAYKRFLDEFFNETWKKKYAKYKEYLPNMLFTIEQGIGLIPNDYMCQGGAGDDGAFLGPFTGAKNMDFVSAEGYIASDEWLGRTSQPQLSLNEKQAYLTLGNGFSAIPNKPVIMIEYGRKVNETSQYFTEEEQSKYYADYLEAAKNAKLTGGNIAWAFGIGNPDEPDNFSLRDASGNLRSAVQAINTFSFPSLPYTAATKMVEVDREKYSFDAWSVKEKYSEVLSLINSGNTVGITSFCSSKNTSSYKTCLDGGSGQCSAKCYNAQFNSFEIKGSDGNWKKIRDGDIIRVAKNQELEFRAKIGNSGEGTWSNSNVILQLNGLETEKAITGNVSGYADTDLGTFTASGISENTIVTANMNITGFTTFGESVEFMLEPEIRFEPTCDALYEGHNGQNDPNRFNIVFLPIEYSTQAEAVKAAKTIVDLDGTTAGMMVSNGFSNVPPIGEFDDKFNYWIINANRKIEFEELPVFGGNCVIDEYDFINDPKVNEYVKFYDACDFIKDTTGISPYYFPLQERYSMLEAEDAREQTCGFGSWGRNGANLAFPEGWEDDSGYTATLSGMEKKNIRDLLSANVHEMSHTIFALWDEYVNVSVKSPQDDHDFFTNFETQNGFPYTPDYVLQHYFTQPDEAPATTQQCIEESPWAKYIGYGCGEPGVIDCFNDPNNIDFGQCKNGTQDCWHEVVCAEGARWEFNSFRPQLNGIMNGHYGQDEIKFGWWDELLVKHILTNGPTDSKDRTVLFGDFNPENYEGVEPPADTLDATVTLNIKDNEGTSVTTLYFNTPYSLEIAVTNTGTQDWDPVWTGSDSTAGTYLIGAGTGSENGKEFIGFFGSINSRYAFSPMTAPFLVGETRTTIVQITPIKTGSTTISFNTLREVDSSSGDPGAWFGATGSLPVRIVDSPVIPTACTLTASPITLLPAGGPVNLTLSIPETTASVSGTIHCGNETKNCNILNGTCTVKCNYAKNNGTTNLVYSTSAEIASTPSNISCTGPEITVLYSGIINNPFLGYGNGICEEGELDDDSPSFAKADCGFIPDDEKKIVIEVFDGDYVTTTLNQDAIVRFNIRANVYNDGASPGEMELKIRDNRTNQIITQTKGTCAYITDSLAKAGSDIIYCGASSFLQLDIEPGVYTVEASYLLQSEANKYIAKYKRFAVLRREDRVEVPETNLILVMLIALTALGIIRKTKK